MIFKYTVKFYGKTKRNTNFKTMYFRLIQAVFVSVAFIGWVAFQLLVRKKRFAEISNDILAIIFFVAVWFGICYWMLD